VTSRNTADMIATLFFALSFFSFGEAVFEGHVNYPAWLRISDQSFVPYHQEIAARIGFLIVPLVLTTVLNILLIWWRPPSIPLWAVWSTLALQILMWLSTVLVQIPIQMRLSSGGYSSDLLERLIWTDFLYRKVPGYIRLAITGWMLYFAVKAEPVEASSEPPNNQMQRTKPAPATTQGD
jgi:hypothetical protein